MDITSLQNPRVKQIVKLREDRRQRLREGLMLVEGWDELSRALDSGLVAEMVITAPELQPRPLAALTSQPVTVSRAVFEKISYRDNPDGWLGVLPIPKMNLGNIRLGNAPLVIVAESVEKPGNLGAILRTADAVGADALLVCDPRVDVWSPNVVRASRGALFTVPTVQVDSPGALDWLRQHRISILAATPAAQIVYTELDMNMPLAITVGTEDQGLTEFWLNNADEQVRIPMFGKVDSLNVSIATALMAYEAVRQRNLSKTRNGS